MLKAEDHNSKLGNVLIFRKSAITHFSHHLFFIHPFTLYAYFELASLLHWYVFSSCLLTFIFFSYSYFCCFHLNEYEEEEASWAGRHCCRTRDNEYLIPGLPCRFPSSLFYFYFFPSYPYCCFVLKTHTYSHN